MQNNGFQNVHTLIAGDYDYSTLHGKGTLQT